ncbi:DUF1963 domain-containing protein [Umezawaea tangerina]|uniref:Uncharacterized protein DUF1963 n=1 Tax=Umezawaea tangerina TaxID=84725 RepID=A0A2T0T235_9PSEU|nr:DUF1963 domain-containing protein [Umezawaea tangerina]PRY39735.1 uncharacterized protein DUF1963 [Umezawaea tangerina]
MAFIDDHTVAELAEEHGVPADVARELTGLLRPCVLLVAQENLPEGSRTPAARTGGLPALPEDVGWPEGAGPFVLSVDCAALPRDWVDLDLPSTGNLLFFTDFRYEPEDAVVLHVPADVPTSERGPEDPEDVETYEPQPLYPVPSLTIDHDWYTAPATTASRESGSADGVEAFVQAVVDSVHDGPRPHAVAQVGGFSDQWQVPPDQDGLVLLAQISGNGVDHDLFTLNLVVGTREDIAAGNWSALEVDQQC